MSRVAIVHDWFTTSAGSEQVVQEILRVFPQADLFSLIDVLPERDRHFLGGRAVHTSFLQYAPLIRDFYRYYLPLMPYAIESLDLKGYDLVISSCHAVAKGIRTSDDQLHVSYIHSPMRYAWDMQDDYFGERGVKAILPRLLLPAIRRWDRAAARRPDKMIANSEFVAARIRKFYSRQAAVIYPPVDVEFFQPGPERENFYLTVSRLAPYKHVDLVARAFAGMPERRLVIIGEGEGAGRLRSLKAANITWLGYQPRDEVRSYMQRCRAFVFAGREDFGITPVEAQACGAPVVAFGEGGVTESVRGLDAAQPSGVFFASQSVSGLQAGIAELERHSDRISAAACRRNAERFSAERFRGELAFFVDAAENEFRSAHAAGLDG